jgi:hypothetical protein
MKERMRRKTERVRTRLRGEGGPGGKYSSAHARKCSQRAYENYIERHGQ